MGFGPGTKWQSELIKQYNLIHINKKLKYFVSCPEHVQKMQQIKRIAKFRRLYSHRINTKIRFERQLILSKFVMNS
jgi:hypothetical protein